MDMYRILESLQAVEKKALSEGVEPVAEITDAEFDADALAKHKSRLKREKTRMGLTLPRSDGGPDKSDVPAAARKARGEEPLTLQDLSEADSECPVTNSIVHRILASRSDLLAAHGPEKILQAAEAVADSVGMVDEIGTSDVSAWVRQVEQELGDEPVSEDDVGEGNEFAGELAKARASGADEFEVDGKTYPVKETNNDDPQLDELSPETLDSYRKKTDKTAYMRVDPTLTGKEKADAQRRDQTRRVGRDRATDKLLAKDLEDMSFEGKKTYKKEPMEEGYADFFDKKMAYQKIGATVDGQAQDYTVTFKDGTRKRYVEKDGRRRVIALEPVDRQDDVDDEGNVVKRGRGRPAGTGRAMGAKGPTGRSKLMREQDIDTADHGEFERKNKMALNQLHQVADAVEELHSILNAEENLPEWVQSKITKAVDYLDTARDYLKAKKSQYTARGEEAIAEKAVSKKQQQAAGAALAAKRGEGKAVGASKEMAKMSTKDLEKFAGTKHKGLPDQVDEVEQLDELNVKQIKKDLDSGMSYDAVIGKHANKRTTNTDEIRKVIKQHAWDKRTSKEKSESVDETTTAGSVATGGEAPTKAKGIFGKGVYEAAIAESFEQKLGTYLTESMSVNVSTDDTGQRNITVTASDEHADQLGELLKMAGMFSTSGYSAVETGEESACNECGGHGGLHEAECPHRMDEEYANEPDEVYGDMELMLNRLSGGLNGPKRQVNPNNPADNPLAMKKLGKTAHSLNLDEAMQEVEQETRSRLMDLYKRYQ